MIHGCIVTLQSKVSLFFLTQSGMFYSSYNFWVRDNDAAFFGHNHRHVDIVSVELIWNLYINVELQSMVINIHTFLNSHSLEH